MASQWSQNLTECRRSEVHLTPEYRINLLLTFCHGCVSNAFMMISLEKQMQSNYFKNF